jgi:hypothetical protein
MNLQQAYARERAPLFVQARDSGRMVESRNGAAQALRNARVKLAWAQAYGFEVAEFECRDIEGAPDPASGAGRVRLLIRNDECGVPDDFDGSERDLQEARERASRDGMCGVESQFWNGAEWVDVDPVWGFIGDDWRGSG